MARISRRLLIFEDYQTHKIWRGHNGEWNLSSKDEKKIYFKYLNHYISKQSNELNAYGNMSNHAHEVYDIKDRNEFSNLMRNHHSRYGMYFNKKHKRKGKVAYDRPKTCLIESDEYSMRAIFYIHANPVRAGIVKNAANYRYSTHNLYAYGKRNEYNKNVKFPNWYTNLGKTWEERQKRYRKFFDEYLREQGLIKQNFLENNFFGSLLWMEKSKENLKNTIKSKCNSPPQL